MDLRDHVREAQVALSKYCQAMLHGSDKQTIHDLCEIAEEKKSMLNDHYWGFIVPKEGPDEGDPIDLTEE